MARSEIYIAAFVPHQDHSIFDRMFADEDIFDPAWIASSRAMAASPDSGSGSRHRETIEHYLFHDCPSDSFAEYWRPFPLPLDLFLNSAWLA